MLPESVTDVPRDKQADESGAQSGVDASPPPVTAESTERAREKAANDARLKKAAAESFHLMGED
jgi:hypothetical protein